MKNKHPEVNHPGPQSNRRKKRDDQLELGFGGNLGTLGGSGGGEGYDNGDSFGGGGGGLSTPQGLSALLSQNATGPNLSALSQLLQAGLLNQAGGIGQAVSGTSLNLFGATAQLGARRFNFQADNHEVVDDDEDDDGPLVIACEDEEDDDSVEEISPSPPPTFGVVKESGSPPPTMAQVRFPSTSVQFNNFNE